MLVCNEKIVPALPEDTALAVHVESRTLYSTVWPCVGETSVYPFGCGTACSSGIGGYVSWGPSSRWMYTAAPTLCGPFERAALDITHTPTSIDEVPGGFVYTTTTGEVYEYTDALRLVFTPYPAVRLAHDGVVLSVPDESEEPPYETPTSTTGRHEEVLYEEVLYYGEDAIKVGEFLWVLSRHTLHTPGHQDIFGVTRIYGRILDTIYVLQDGVLTAIEPCPDGDTAIDTGVPAPLGVAIAILDIYVHTVDGLGHLLHHINNGEQTFEMKKIGELDPRAHLSATEATAVLTAAPCPVLRTTGPLWGENSSRYTSALHTDWGTPDGRREALMMDLAMLPDSVRQPLLEMKKTTSSVGGELETLIFQSSQTKSSNTPTPRTPRTQTIQMFGVDDPRLVSEALNRSTDYTTLSSNGVTLPTPSVLSSLIALHWTGMARQLLLDQPHLVSPAVLVECLLAREEEIAQLCVERLGVQDVGAVLAESMHLFPPDVAEWMHNVYGVVPSGDSMLVAARTNPGVFRRFFDPVAHRGATRGARADLLGSEFTIERTFRRPPEPKEPKEEEEEEFLIPSSDDGVFWEDTSDTPCDTQWDTPCPEEEEEEFIRMKIDEHDHLPPQDWSWGFDTSQVEAMWDQRDSSRWGSTDGSPWAAPRTSLPIIFQPNRTPIPKEDEDPRALITPPAPVVPVDPVDEEWMTDAFRDDPEVAPYIVPGKPYVDGIKSYIRRQLHPHMDDTPCPEEEEEY